MMFLAILSLFGCDVGSRDSQTPVDCAAAATAYASACDDHTTEAEVLKTKCGSYETSGMCEDYAWSSTWAGCIDSATSCDDADVCSDAAYAAECE